MNILHTITGMGIMSGGTSTCSYQLLKGLNSIGVHADILCFSPSGQDKLIGEEMFIKTVPASPSNRLMYSSNFSQFLNSHPEFELYHANGLWQYPIHATSKHARNTNKPYIISPHGMLYPEALQNSKWIKKAYSFLVQNRDLKNANVIHATCIQEMINYRSLGFKNPVAVIANPINTESIEQPFKSKHGKRRIGFLGRLHVRKNVETLILAIAKLKHREDVELCIIGGGDEHYINYLKVLAKTNGVNNIIFHGFLTGQQKDDVINSLSFLAVPSAFENFGMIIAEALVKGIPVIASKGTPWIDLHENQCGWWIENDIDTFTETIKIALNMPEEDRIAMGINGKNLIKKKYSVEIVSQKMSELYNWILNDTNRPDFIY